LSVSNNTPDLDLGELTRLTLLSYEISGPDVGAFSLTNFTPGIQLDKDAAQDLDLLFTASGPNGVRSTTLTLLTDEGAGLGLAGHQFSFAFMAAVPEPETIGMMVTGLGCLGVVMLRRGRAARRGQRATPATPRTATPHGAQIYKERKLFTSIGVSRLLYWTA